MSTRRKAHPDHYQTHPEAPHDPGLQRQHHLGDQGERATSPTPRAREPSSIRAGEHASRALVLNCSECGAGIAVLAGQQVAICGECGGTSYRLSA